jgi:hypothetical protein
VAIPSTDLPNNAGDKSNCGNGSAYLHHNCHRKRASSATGTVPPCGGGRGVHDGAGCLYAVRYESSAGCNDEGELVESLPEMEWREWDYSIESKSVEPRQFQERRIANDEEQRVGHAFTRI